MSTWAWALERIASGDDAGRIIAAGETHEVEFSVGDPELNDQIDDAYRAKYAGSPYLPPMVAPGPQERSRHEKKDEHGNGAGIRRGGCRRRHCRSRRRSGRFATGLNAEGRRALAVQCDVFDEAQVDDAVARTVDAFGGLDMAFNNAGIMLPPVDSADERRRLLTRLSR